MSTTRYKIRLWEYDGEASVANAVTFDSFAEAEARFNDLRVSEEMPCVEFIKERIANGCIIGDEVLNVRQFASVFDASLSCLNPFWREETETREDIATWIGGFEFPVPDGLELYDGWEIGYRQPSLIVNVYNSGDVKSGIRIEFRAIGAVTNPVLLNVDTREFIKLNISLVAGDVLTVSTGYGEKAVKLNRGGTITDAFRYLDVDSSYLQIAVGDNLFRYSADANAENLEVSIYHNNLYLGV